MNGDDFNNHDFGNSHIEWIQNMRQPAGDSYVEAMNLRPTAANLFSDTRLKGGQDIATEEPLEAPSQNSKD